MWDPYAEFETAVLPNGLTVHAAHWPGRSWLAMGFLIHIGAMHDPVGLEGLAHFIEHIISQNAIVPKKAIRDFFEDYGGSVDLGATGYPDITYDFFAPADPEVLRKAFSLLGHMLLHVRIKNSVENERQVIIGEFHRSYPMKFWFEEEMRENRILYPGLWPERFLRPLGALESIQRITQENLQTYYDAHFTPRNMSIVGVGGMRLHELVELLLESPFASTKDGHRTPLAEPVTEFPPLTETRHVFTLSEHTKVPSEVGGYYSAARIPGTVSVQALNIFCAMFSAVLHEEAREKLGWTYEIRSSFTHGNDFSRFYIDCGALAVRALDQIEELIEICIASMGGREDLLQQVKRQIIESNLMLDVTGRRVRDGALADLSKYKQIIPLAENTQDVAHVTMTELRSVLRWLEPGKRWTRIRLP